MKALILPNLIPSELTYTLEKYPNAIVFIEDNIFPYDISNPIFPIHNVNDYIGDLYVFSLDHAKIAMNVLSPVTVHFIAWDLEWLYGKTNYLENIEIYRKVDHLYCRPGHATALKNYCNREPKWILQL